MAPIKMAPPTPTTTPMIMFFWLEDSPESESSEDPLSPGDSVASLDPLLVLVNVVGTGVPSMVWVVVIVVTEGVDVGSSLSSLLSELVLVLVLVDSAVVVVVVVGSDVVVVDRVVEVSSSDVVVDVEVVVDSFSLVVEVSVVSVVDVSVGSESVVEESVGVGRTSVMVSVS
jgi:hypothetical protein